MRFVYILHKCEVFIYSIYTNYVNISHTILCGNKTNEYKTRTVDLGNKFFGAQFNFYYLHTRIYVTYCLNKARANSEGDEVPSNFPIEK